MGEAGLSDKIAYLALSHGNKRPMRPKARLIQNKNNFSL
jgi:hypothetical protein